MIIKEIKAIETHKLRLEILKTNTNYMYQYKDDFSKKTIHFAAFIKNKIVGIITLMENQNPYFLGKQLQLRGMAVQKEIQSNGVGRKLIEKALFESKKRNVNILWCNAREYAVPFYEKLDFKLFGDRFFIENVCYHYLMFKKINQANAT